MTKLRAIRQIQLITAKPKFDTRLYSTMVSLIKEKNPLTRDTDIMQKVQSVQKKYTLNDFFKHLFGNLVL